MLTAEQKNRFESEGYLIIKGLLSPKETGALRGHFMGLHAAGPIPGVFEPQTAEQSGRDILKQYPRMMHPHKVDAVSKNLMLNPRVMEMLNELFGEEALAAQSMFYFKPPGAKGQALHQDNFYLKIEPGTCIAAWTALDAADEENGGMFIVPRSHKEQIQCPHEANPEESFTRDEVAVPEGLHAVPTALGAGDILFFNGSVIHGSYPNLSKDRFRRAFICHYAGISTTKAGSFYSPMFRVDGTEISVEVNETAGPCGTEFQSTAQPH